MAARHRLVFPARPSELGSYLGVLREHLPGWAATERTLVALGEALGNAIVHGALGLGSACRERGEIERYLDDLEHAEARHGAVRSVSVSVIDHDGVLFVTVSDPGAGFDVSKAPVRPGRGLALIHALTDGVSWNGSGNQVTLRWMRSS